MDLGGGSDICIETCRWLSLWMEVRKRQALVRRLGLVGEAGYCLNLGEVGEARRDMVEDVGVHN